MNGHYFEQFVDILVSLLSGYCSSNQPPIHRGVLTKMIIIGIHVTPLNYIKTS